MDHKTVEEYVLSMPNAKLDYPFGKDVAVYKVDDKMFALIAGIALPLFLVILFYYIFNFSVRRFHDLGLSGWWAIMRIIPGCEIVLLLLPGTEGSNRFGDQPTKKFDFNELF